LSLKADEEKDYLKKFLPSGRAVSPLRDYSRMETFTCETGGLLSGGSVAGLQYEFEGV
jgi:hypothetical protein